MKENRTMTSYNAIAEVDIAPTARRSEGWLAALEGYHPAVGRTEDGRAELTITIEGDYFDETAARALLILSRAAGQLLTFAIMPTDEFDRRVEREETSRDLGLMDTRAAAERLGVSRQRMQQLHQAGTIRGIPVGSSLAWPQDVIERYAASRAQME